MKKIMLSFTVLLLLAACGGSDSGKKEEPKEKVTDITKHPDYKKGLALVAKDNCLTCHNVSEGIQGPSYRDVANKYKDYPDTIIAHLAGKIRTGGTGVWGEIWMTPHMGLSQEDAEAMVRYILLLKNK